MHAALKVDAAPSTAAAQRLSGMSSALVPHSALHGEHSDVLGAIFASKPPENLPSMATSCE
jgi:hypothetical protein